MDFLKIFRRFVKQKIEEIHPFFAIPQKKKTKKTINFQV
ncbi:MAG: hypothetical protein CM15mP107_2450 [Bacteroidota bacterium]|nr:MAG: hypothetical protein CM15mP107_2450 [Bacteroidota bacterium]